VLFDVDNRNSTMDVRIINPDNIELKGIAKDYIPNEYVNMNYTIGIAREFEFNDKSVLRLIKVDEHTYKVI